MQAFNARSGKPLWTIQFPTEASFDTAPVAQDGIVYAMGAGSGSSFYAIDETTGQISWAGSATSTAWPSSIPTITAGSVFFAMPCEVAAYNKGTGKPIWNYTVTESCDGAVGARSAYFLGDVYASYVTVVSGAILGSKTGTFLGPFTGMAEAFDGDLSYLLNSYISAINVKTGNLAWTFAPPSALYPPIVVNGTLFAYSGTGMLYALNGTTGTVLQTLTLGVGTGGFPNTGGLGAGQGVLVVPSGNLLVALKPVEPVTNRSPH